MAGKFFKRKKKILWLIDGALILLAVVVGISIFQLVRTQKEYRDGEKLYDSIAENAIASVAADRAQTGVDGSQVTVVIPVREQKEEQQEDQTAFVVDFDYLRSINPDIAAWIVDPSQTISYPVVQGTDNDYYLRRMVDKTQNSNGSIFLDYRSSAAMTDKNTFIYGHNMRNGAMFASLTQYASQSYYDAHPELFLLTPDGCYCLQVFCGYVTQGSSESYQMEFASEDEFSSYLELIRGRSAFRSAVPVTPQDRIVTLSTCAYDHEDARFVVHCKLLPMQ